MVGEEKRGEERRREGGEEGTLTSLAGEERRGEGRKGEEGTLTSIAGEKRRGEKRRDKRRKDTHSNGRRGEERGHSLQWQETKGE